MYANHCDLRLGSFYLVLILIITCSWIIDQNEPQVVKRAIKFKKIVHYRYPFVVCLITACLYPAMSAIAHVFNTKSEIVSI